MSALPRVLFVDDEPLIVSSIRRAARGRLNLVTAQTVAQARERLNAERFDIVVSDYRMPDGSGLELLRWALEQHPYLAERFLLLSGSIEARLIEESPVPVLAKPLGIEELTSAIQARLDGVL